MDNRKKKKPEEVLSEVDLNIPIPAGIDAKDTPQEPVETPVEPVEVVEEVVDPVVPEEAPQDPVETPVEPKKVEEYKEKFSNSSREAMALHFKNEKLQSAIQSVSDIPEPTQEELVAFAKSRGAEYEDLDDFSKAILRDTYTNTKGLEKIKGLSQELRDNELWNKRVDDFMNDSTTVKTFPSLADYEDEFRRFCSKDSRRGSDLNDLVASFLYMQDKVPTVKHKGSLLMSGGNGQAVPTKPAKVTEDEAASIRIRDPKEYRRLIKAGKISIDL